MNKDELRNILERVSSGELSCDDAIVKFKTEPYEDLGFAKLDTHRGIRQGAPEVIYAAGKTKEQILNITQKMLSIGEKSVLITRLSKDNADYLKNELPLFYDELSKIAVAGTFERKGERGNIVVACAGTSDIPVAEEAALTAEFYNNNVKRLYDVGVAGIHRLTANIDTLSRARVIVACAGMEGALASVIAGLVDCPVIAVPTSAGYGASFGGVSALLSMLNSCAGGVSVVNIDNGFGAVYLANMINNM